MKHCFVTFIFRLGKLALEIAGDCKLKYSIHGKITAVPEMTTGVLPIRLAIWSVRNTRHIWQRTKSVLCIYTQKFSSCFILARNVLSKTGTQVSCDGITSSSLIAKSRKFYPIITIIIITKWAISSMRHTWIYTVNCLIFWGQQCT